MATSPLEAEARGLKSVTASYGGADFEIPLDADDWPLDLIAVSLGVTENDRITVRHNHVAAAMTAILGDQWPTFIAAAPKRRDLAAASQLFAAAIGFPATVPGVDKVFGALPRRLHVLQRWPDAVETTLRRVGFDYRDRWRFDEAGRRHLTLRQVHVELDHAPYDSPLIIAQNGGRRPYSDAALAIFDLYQEISGKPHPSRPLPESERRARLELAAQQQQARENYNRRAHGGNKSAAQTARENARFAQRKANENAE